MIVSSRRSNWGEKRPLSTLGLTESRQIKIDGLDGESVVKPR
jgi:hypothetical protein